MEKISAIIPSYNEEIHIKGAIESVLWADEVIVVDSFSNDNTAAICKSFEKVKFIQHEYIHSAAQKNWIIPQAENDWIFLLDADERCTPELEAEIKSMVENKTSHSAFWIHRRNFIMGRELKHVWNSDAVIRLFRKSVCKYQDKHVHAEIETSGSISKLKNKIIHEAYKSMEVDMRKAYRYTTWGAYDRLVRIDHVGVYHLIVRPFFTFLKHYILNKGILDGVPGLYVSAMGAWNSFIRSVKIWRIKNGENIPRK